MSELNQMFSDFFGNPEQSASLAAFAERHNIRSAPALTVTDVETAALIAEHLAPS